MYNFTMTIFLHFFVLFLPVGGHKEVCRGGDAGPGGAALPLPQSRHRPRRHQAEDRGGG